MSKVTQFISNSGAGGYAQTLTGNSGGAVPPTAGNINVIGGTGINIVGNSSTSTLTVSTTGVTTLTYTAVSTSPYIVLTTDDFLGVNSSGGTITIELPNAPSTGRVWIIKDSTGSSATHNITITTVGGTVNIDGSTSFVMNTNYESINVLFDGTTYQVY